MKKENRQGKKQEKQDTRRRVLIVDDHSVLREGLRMVIDQQPDLVVCGEAADAPRAMEAVEALKPDIVIVDLSLDGSSGLELVKDIKARFPGIPTLVLSLHDESLYAERVVRAGARGYIMKRSSSSELLAALREVLNGNVYLSENMSSRIMKQVFGRHEIAPEQASIEVLSDRELEVFQLIGEGHGTSDIAKRLCLSMKTVSCYRQNIKNKLHLKDATELVQHAIHWTSNLQEPSENR
jgi:DNA-binding NarL/FixJ family response regulator